MTFPALRSALLAGGLLAFALSFDEVIVTIFTAGGVKTLPIWIFQSFRLANQLPLVNVAGRGLDPALGHPGLHRDAGQSGPSSGRDPGAVRQRSQRPPMNLSDPAMPAMTKRRWQTRDERDTDASTHEAPPRARGRGPSPGVG